MRRLKGHKGFTLIEVMIAIAIFGLLMLYITQFLRLEIKLYDQAISQNEVDQKGRIVMMHLLDEIRFNGKAVFSTGKNVGDPGVFYLDSDGNALVDITPGTLVEELEEYLFYDKLTNSFWLRKRNVLTGVEEEYEIANEVAIEITPGTISSQFVKISVKSLPDQKTEAYSLITWARLN